MTNHLLAPRSRKKPIVDRLFAVLGTCVLLCAQPVCAQVAAITEQESLHIGLARPDIARVIEGEREAARSEADAAGRWPNPTLEIQRESIPAAGARTVERSLMLSQQLDLSGKRALRKSAANERAFAASLDGDLRKMEAAAEIRLRFFEALYYKEVVEAARNWDARMASVGSTVQKLHQGGEVAGYDRRRMALEHASVQAQLRSQQAAYDKSKEQLMALVGTPGNGREPAGTLLPDAPVPLETLLARLEQRPDLRAAERRAEAYGLERQAAQRGWIPDVTLGVGSKTVDNGGARERGNVVSISVPLPLFDRDQSGAAKAGALAETARGEARLQRARFEGEVRGLWQQVRQLHAAATDYELQQGSALDDLARIAESSYRGGEAGIVELLDAYRAVHEAKVRALELSWSARKAAIDLDTIAGNEKP